QIGHVYGWGELRPDRFGGPDPGAAATMDAISNVTGLQLDHFVLVDLTGFADVVDAFGGVDLDVEIPIDGPLYDVETGTYEMVHIPVGAHHLDGAHALAYARARYGSSDYVRMGRQRCILAAMAAQADLLDLFGRLGGLLDAVESNLVTDIPMKTIPDLIRLTPRIDASGIRVIGFDSKWGIGRTPTGHVVPDIERIREAVRATVENPKAAADFGAGTAETGC
ncbi:MAG TPA: LCP family protein, partial [Acidimicrobiia bacterium]|nr:LCP family protein [Acidimicrobiia bacterium]